MQAARFFARNRSLLSFKLNTRHDHPFTPLSPMHVGLPLRATAHVPFAIGSMAKAGFIGLCGPRLTSLNSSTLSPHRHCVLAACSRAQTMSIPGIPADRAARNRPWVRTHKVHNALLTNHFLDLLEVHGDAHGLMRDDTYPGYDPAGSHALRMQRLSNEFRRQVMGAFARRLGVADVACISPGPVSGPATVERERTEKAIRERRPMIVGAVVADEGSRVVARIPMLLRVDVAQDLFGWKVGKEEDAGVNNCIYIPVGVKRRPLEINREGTIRGNSLARMQAEMWLWNRLLGSVQGYELGTGLLVGLHPKRSKAIPLGAFVNVVEDGVAEGMRPVFDETVWRVARVPFSDIEASYSQEAQEALAWRVNVIDNGETWITAAMERAILDGKEDKGNGIMHLAATATDPRLRPNMKCPSMYDAPWSKAKRMLAEELREVTMVSGVSYGATSEAMEKGVPNDFAHPRVTAEELGISSQFTKTVLEMCKPSYRGPLVKPKQIPHNCNNWRRLEVYDKNNKLKFDKSGPELQFADERTFYIDFELASPEYLCASAEKRGEQRAEQNGDYNLYFDVDPSVPIQEDSTTDALVFMIGCGRVLSGEWHHRVFTSAALTQVAESALIREWFEYMDSALPRQAKRPILHVWGPEKNLLKKSVRRMCGADAEAVKQMRHVDVVNVLDVMKTGCVTIRGNLKNSLKSACWTLDRHGLLNEFAQREDEEVVTNGADAMTLGLHGAEVALREGLESLRQAPKMGEVARYNEADCRDIARVITYLRKHH